MATKKQDRHIAALRRKADRLEARVEALHQRARDSKYAADDAYLDYSAADAAYRDALYAAYPEKRPARDPFLDRLDESLRAMTPAFTVVSRPVSDIMFTDEDKASLIEWEQSDNFTGLERYRRSQQFT